MMTRKQLILIGIATLLLVVLAIPGVQAQDQEVEACAAPSWQGTFFNTNNLTGSQMHILCRQLIDFPWGGGQPYRGVNADNFSMRWTTTQSFPTAGEYAFTATVFGGARLYINGQLIFDDMSDVQALRDISGVYTIDTASKAYSMTLEYAAYAGDAYLRLNWSLISGADPAVIQDHAVTAANPIDSFKAGGGNVWYIEHFIGTSTVGTPVAFGIHSANGISYDYEEAAPKAGLPRDGWASRWTRVVDFPAGTYTFTFRTEDGGLVTIDGQPLDNITSIAGGITGTKTLTAGRHMIVVEHWDMGGTESIFLTWDPPYGTNLHPDGCNGHYTAGVNSNAALCPDRGLAVANP